MSVKDIISRSAMKAIFVLAIACLCCMAIPAAAEDEIKIGAAVSLTGNFAAGGKDLQSGYELAVKHINDDGGIYVKDFGKKVPINLIIENDESDTTKTVSRMEKLNSVDKVAAYLGGFASGMNVPQLAIAEKNKAPWVGVTIAVDAPFVQGYKYVFRAWDNGFLDTESLIGVIESISGDKRPTKLAYWSYRPIGDWRLAKPYVSFVPSTTLR